MSYHFFGTGTNIGIAKDGTPLQGLLSFVLEIDCQKCRISYTTPEGTHESGDMDYREVTGQLESSIYMINLEPIPKVCLKHVLFGKGIPSKDIFITLGRIQTLKFSQSKEGSSIPTLDLSIAFL